MAGMFPKQMYIAETFLRAKPASPSMVPRNESGSTYITFHAQNISYNDKEPNETFFSEINALTMVMYLQCTFPHGQLA